MLKVPNTALRYKPPLAADEILAVYKQYHIEGAESKQGQDPPAPDAQTAEAVVNRPGASKTDTAIVWKFHADNSMEPVKVSLGITDHAYTEVRGLLKGELKEEDAVIIRSVTSKTQIPGGLGR